jgi:hypothetical protein
MTAVLTQPELYAGRPSNPSTKKRKEPQSCTNYLPLHDDTFTNSATIGNIVTSVGELLVLANELCSVALNPNLRKEQQRSLILKVHNSIVLTVSSHLVENLRQSALPYRLEPRDYQNIINKRPHPPVKTIHNNISHVG